jgi:two-component system copper resistance phosphate regulon response regulator CusR
MGIRLLVVEDEAKIAKFLVRGLREEGYTVEHSADGKAAWYALRSGRWDLVLLDWWLPDEDGLTVLQRFRQVDRRTPVLLLTARDGVSDRVRGLDAGADDYLCKPFAFDELLARVRALIRRREAVDGTTLAYGDVRVDLATGRADRDGHPLDLTAKEQALLVFFLRHPDQVVTRTRIYENVWDERYDGISNTIEVHVKELRRKLEARGHRLIHTLRNRGYVLGEPPDATPGENS